MLWLWFSVQFIYKPIFCLMLIIHVIHLNYVQAHFQSGLLSYSKTWNQFSSSESLTHLHSALASGDLKEFHNLSSVLLRWAGIYVVGRHSGRRQSPSESWPYFKWGVQNSVQIAHKRTAVKRDEQRWYVHWRVLPAAGQRCQQSPLLHLKLLKQWAAPGASKTCLYDRVSFWHTTFTASTFFPT